MEKKLKAILDTKAFIAICCGIGLSLAILTFSNRVTTPNRNNPLFRYGTGSETDAPIHVIDNNRVEVPFAFNIGHEIQEISLAFSGDHIQMPGIALRDKTAKVVNGKASSTVIIHFIVQPALKAGTHFLTVLARDPATGKIIRDGKIPFTYNMHEVIGKCSC
jgi:hypothetical protein